MVQQTVDYFTQRGSTVSALDATKAFDKVNHNVLIRKLVAKNTPKCLVNIITNWYHKLNAVVRWNGILSYNFNVFCGVRQGGVLSPLLFNVYVDDLICQLESSSLGCCINGIYIGCVMYADDLLLMSTSISTLQSMLDLCHLYGVKHNIIFNSKKSYCMKVGHDHSADISNMLMHNVSIE